MKQYILIAIFLLSALSVQTFANNVDTVVSPVESLALGGDEKVVLYPNPANTVTQLKVNVKDVKVSEVAIYGILGNQLFHKKYDGFESDIQINVQNYKKGKYLVKIVFDDGTSEVKALIKQ